MATTPKGIYYPVVGDVMTPLASRFAALATSVDTALGEVNPAGHYTGTLAERALLEAPDLREGIYWYSTDTNLMAIYNGSAWKNIVSRFVGAKVVKNVAQSWSTSLEAITWNNASAAVDTDGFYSTGANTRLTAPFDGLYRVSWSLLSSGVISASTHLYINGVTTGFTNSSFGQAGSGTNPKGTTVVSLTAGQYVTIMQVSPSTAGGAWGTTGNCVFEIEYLGQV